MKKTGAAIVLFVGISFGVIGQYSSAQIDSIVSYAMTKFDVAGVAVGVVKDGKIIHKKGYGVTSVNTKNRVNEHTNFAIASNSKAFTTAALAILVDEGKIQWTDKVRKYIPEFTMYNAYVTENFNIQDLLTHRSGLGLGVGDLMIFPDGSDFTMDDILQSFQYFEPVSAFRTQYDYDNLLYLVAGELIARVSGMSYEDFITTQILNPLQMGNTAASLHRITNQKNLAKPHANTDEGLIEVPSFQPMVNSAAGGIYANVNDLCNWMLVQLNHGRYGNDLQNELFSAANHREMWTIHTVTTSGRNPRYNSHFSGYGLGWELEDIRGNLMASHTGGLPGMLSKTTLIPDLGVGIVILTNTSDDGAGIFASVTNVLVDSYLGLEPVAWIDRYAEYFESRKATGDSVLNAVWEAVKTVDKSHINEEDYIGVYADDWFGKMEIFKKDGQLWIKSYRQPKLNGAIHYYQANTFAIKWEYTDMNADAFAMFFLDENGKALSFKMKGISPNIDFSFDFHDLDLKRMK